MRKNGYRLLTAIIFIVTSLHTLPAYSEDTPAFKYRGEPDSPANKPDYQDLDKLTDKPVYVGEIIIAGNEKTDEDIITREMSTKPGQELSIEILKEDIQRISNLGLFTRVQVLPVPVSDTEINLVIEVEESFYFLPIPQGGFKENNLNKFWAGLNLKLRNFRGRNETLGLSFGLWYEPFVKASYTNPWIEGTDHIFTSVSFGYAKNFNKSFDGQTFNTPIDKDNISDYKVFSFDSDLKVGKYLTKNLSLASSLSYNIIQLSEYQPGRTAAPDGKDNFATGRLIFEYDTRNLRSYTTYGSYYNVQYAKYGFFNQYIDFNRFNFDLRRFVPIKLGDEYAITFASRSLGVISYGGNIPSYLRVLFGFSKIIRGWDEKVLEGDNQLGFMNEVRIPIIQPGYIEGKKLPLIKGISFLKKLSYKYGLYLTFFYDVGGVWNKNDDFFKTAFKNGYGAGLNFILPFNFVGRFEGALRNENGEYFSEYTIALSASF